MSKQEHMDRLVLLGFAKPLLLHNQVVMIAELNQ
jgi:hypothetical protein